MLNCDKYHFMALGKPNTFPSFKFNNITIKESVFEKLLGVITDNGVIIDNKLDFSEHLNVKGKNQI